MSVGWDVLQTIVTVLDRFDVLPNLECVKGHQDDDAACCDLSLPAQSNIDAEKLAGRFKHKVN